jgi:Flp pilus assembly protein TadG
MATPPRRDESGLITAMVVILVGALFVLAGAVIDGGSAIAAHESAIAEAEQAARAGADALSPSSLRGGGLAPDPNAAVSAAETYMAQAGHPGTASVNGDVVTAQVTPYQVPSTLLGLVGFKSFTISGSASARPVTKYPTT